MVDIAVISGSKSDQLIVDRILGRLKDEGVSFEHRVLSAHRNPKELEEYVSGIDPLDAFRFYRESVGPF